MPSDTLLRPTQRFRHALLHTLQRLYPALAIYPVSLKTIHEIIDSAVDVAVEDTLKAADYAGRIGRMLGLSLRFQAAATPIPKRRAASSRNIGPSRRLSAGPAATDAVR